VRRRDRISRATQEVIRPVQVPRLHSGLLAKNGNHRVIGQQEFDHRAQNVGIGGPLAQLRRVQTGIP